MPFDGDPVSQPTPGDSPYIVTGTPERQTRCPTGSAGAPGARTTARHLFPRAARGTILRPMRTRSPAPVVRPEVVATYPHDFRAWTQGLLCHDGCLLESTGGFGHSSMRRVRLETGAVELRADLPPQLFAEGAAVQDGTLYQLTWRNQVVILRDPATLVEVGSLGFQGEGWGLTSDGTALVRSDGTPVLTFHEPGSFRPLRTLTVTHAGVPVPRLNELQWMDGEIWANAWYTPYIACIDAASGEVRRWVDLSEVARHAVGGDPHRVANGIARDPRGGRVFVTGKQWPHLYEIRLP